MGLLLRRDPCANKIELAHHGKALRPEVIMKRPHLQFFFIVDTGFPYNMDSSLGKVPDKPHSYANLFVASILISFENHTSRLKSVVCSTLELFLSDTTQRTRNVLATRRVRYRECLLFHTHFSITEGRMFLITLFSSAELRSC